MSLVHWILPVLMWAGPFDPAPPFDGDVETKNGRCCHQCRVLEKQVEHLTRDLAATADEVKELRKRLLALEKANEKRKSRAGGEHELAPGVQWLPNTVYERGPDGLLYFRDREPKAPKVQLVPVIVPSQR